MTEVHYVEIDSNSWGATEIEKMGELLAAWNGSGSVKIGFNTGSGYVFLVDDNENVYMMNGNKIEQFHSCPNCGNEGFIDEIKENMDGCYNCEEIVRTFSNEEQCGNCKDWFSELDNNMCDSCNEDHAYCESCDNYVTKEEYDMNNDVCNDCHNNQEDDVEINPIERNDE